MAVLLVVLTSFVCAWEVLIDPSFFLGSKKYLLIPVIAAAIYLVGRLLSGKGSFFLTEIARETPAALALVVDLMALVTLSYFLYRLQS